ncbi:uncharacterized protein L203_103816 [Cryptococcus depauperatus CBS 7841]|uniref:Uncharacterized protein n=1 Tax=Cryptococcus depauperatus CBS 7841 TaxID=1295531 RepID=A0A1E3IGN7_9TREE|nr:hypothetical protein L203_03684 [Cryptococcus depauperatus CBS 7841]
MSEDRQNPRQQEEEQQKQQQQETTNQSSYEPSLNLPPAPGPRTHHQNTPRSETALSRTQASRQQLNREAEDRDHRLGPLRSHRQPLPNEMSELLPEEQPGGTHKDEHSLSINIALDLIVEVHLTARVKGDVTIGLL